jgi:hypothetical protein
MSVDEALSSESPAELIDTIVYVAELRVADARRSTDAIVRELAHSSRMSPSNDRPSETVPRKGLAQADLSTMVHGTWGWKGRWWYPGGDYFNYIEPRYRELYDGGMEFTWSGAFSQRQRELAGRRFQRWVQGSPDGGLRTAFAHSYGCEVAARAINGGSHVNELVLLSSPINDHIRAAAARVDRLIDVRLEFDIALQLAGEQQEWTTLPPNAHVHIVKQHFWSHSATHSPKVWADEGIATAVGL